jgi:hypothetical protein
VDKAAPAANQAQPVLAFHQALLELAAALVAEARYGQGFQRCGHSDENLAKIAGYSLDFCLRAGLYFPP